MQTTVLTRLSDMEQRILELSGRVLKLEEDAAHQRLAMTESPAVSKQNHSRAPIEIQVMHCSGEYSYHLFVLDSRRIELEKFTRIWMKICIFAWTKGKKRVNQFECDSVLVNRQD